MIAPVAGTPFDFRPERQPLGRCGPAIETVPPAAPAGTHRGIDHTYLIRGWQPDGRLRTGALLRDPASGRRLELLSDQPGVQVYMGNFLDGTLVGKGGTAYKANAARRRLDAGTVFPGQAADVASYEIFVSRAREPAAAAPRPAMKSARLVLFLLALVVSVVAPDVPAAPADDVVVDDLPADTNTIERLAPDQARRLAADFPGAEQEIIVRGSFQAIFYEALPLNGLKALDADTAGALAGYGKEPLVLNGLTTLDAAAAKALAEYKGAWLVLNGLTELDPAAARALAEYKGVLILNGLTTLDAATAKALAEFRGKWLGLGGLADLDADAAKALAAVRCEMMDLSGLRTLGAEAATMLAGLRTPNLVLNGLPTLDAASATALADFKGQHLELGGLESFDADAARALAKSRAWDGRFLKLATLDAPTAEALAERGGNSLMFDRLAALDAETAQALAAFKGNLFLQSLRRLDVDVAQALATSKSSMLVLGSLAEVDPDVVRAFGEYAGMLGVGEEVVERFVAMHPLSPENALGIASLSHGELGFLTALESPDSVEIAEALAARKGRLALPNLKKISPKTLTALIKKEDVEIPLIETLEFIPEPDGSPTEDFVIPKGFQGQ
ncbi:MAG: hypothetical protein LW698_09870 [Planctomycetaceae bacterium]|nr:hypothetical protein [Planctomycetaceae bacterium]